MQISRLPQIANELGPMFFIQLSIFSVVVVGFIVFFIGLLIECMKKKNNNI